jgi:LemA protein
MKLIFIIIAATITSAAVLYNKFVRYKMLMKEALSGIDVQLKRRHELIPNIVDVVKGYAQYERGTLTDITKLREELVLGIPDKKKAELENNLSGALRQVLALVENYPELKANKSFLELQKTLSEIEDQLQLARRYYNGTVRNYNVLVESFPSNTVARLSGFMTAKFFEIAYATERESPDVEFS